VAGLVEDVPDCAMTGAAMVRASKPKGKRENLSIDVSIFGDLSDRPPWKRVVLALSSAALKKRS
jgi:hypothetical protein